MDEQEFAQLNIIPLVDVMLVLLTIVLTTSTFAARGRLPVDLPRASHAGPAAYTLPGARNPTVIELGKDGAIALDGVPMSMVQLSGRLGAIQASRPVLIRSDRGIRLQSFIDLVDLLKGLGFTRVSVQTEGAHAA